MPSIESEGLARSRRLRLIVYKFKYLVFLMVRKHEGETRRGEGGFKSYLPGLREGWEGSPLLNKKRYFKNLKR